MVRDLMSHCISSFDVATVFTTIDLLCWSPYKYKAPADGPLLRDIVSLVLAYAEDNSPYFSYDQEMLIEYYQIPAILHPQIFTDDSFQVCSHFHSVV